RPNAFIESIAVGSGIAIAGKVLKIMKINVMILKCFFIAVVCFFEKRIRPLHAVWCKFFSDYNKYDIDKMNVICKIWMKMNNFSIRSGCE
ncbi:MAG: hypothetical protein KDE57_02665, partial [Calditrichaeota bacterium]|nr:hypothetical protein [Calditrichota bacterium]